MLSLRMVSTEVSALGAAALSLPLRVFWRHDEFDLLAPHPTPVVVVHGLLGDPTNFLTLRRHLSTRGVGNFRAFSYFPRIDYQRLAYRLGHHLEALCLTSGMPQVDVVGHSLGGLVARYLVETDDARRVRRLVTLGSPYFATRVPSNELAIYGADDPLIPAPHLVHVPRGARREPAGRILIVPECGHWGVLRHPIVLREVGAFLCSPDAAGHEAAPLAFGAAS
jgi:pimeloyl-ACP methyl ester carboxylesterase